jgi:hypothetical protein
MNDAERNYPVHEQELLAVVHALREWRHHLHGAKFEVVTDHLSLKYFLTQPKLSARQARWSEFLQEFDMTITHRAGKLNQAADALSRRPDHQSISNITQVNISAELVDKIRQKFSNTLLRKRIVRANENITEKDGLLWAGDSKLLVPNDNDIKQQLLHEYHDSPLNGHMGTQKLYEKLSRHWFWIKMKDDVEEYIKSCHSCQQNKTSNQKPMGLITQLPRTVGKGGCEMVYGSGCGGV